MIIDDQTLKSSHIAQYFTTLKYYYRYFWFKQQDKVCDSAVHKVIVPIQW